MQVIDIIKELQKEGNNVKYRKRSDGGYIITEINGIKYTGANGNNTARHILGISLSDKSLTQRRSNVEKFIKIPVGKNGKKLRSKYKNDLSEEEIKKIKEIQKLSRKHKGKGQGTISKPTARRYRQKYGKKALEEMLSKKLKYYQGYAYEENVKLLITRLERLKIQFSDNNKILSYLDDSIDVLEAHLSNIKEEYIAPIYEKIYDLQKTKSIGSAQALNTYIHSII